MKKKYIVVLLSFICGGKLLGMKIELNSLKTGRDAIILSINPDLYLPLIERLKTHAMVHSISDHPDGTRSESGKEVLPVRIFLAKGVTVKSNFFDRKSFLELLEDIPNHRSLKTLSAS